MFEKVNPMHPDKIADRIAGAMVDEAYRREENPRIAAEVLIGHGTCHIITETSVHIPRKTVVGIVERIAGDMEVIYQEYPQDRHLAGNQRDRMRCGDNGIFKGTPVTQEQRELTDIAEHFYRMCRADGKYISDNGRITVCQSHLDTEQTRHLKPEWKVNPLGDWTGGPDVDTGATNRKLGSDMGDSVTGGGLHGKDLSKADVSVNIYAWLKAQVTGEPVELTCSIGDEEVDGRPFSEIAGIARNYIKTVGGFEKFSEWGLIRPDDMEHFHK